MWELAPRRPYLLSGAERKIEPYEETFNNLLNRALDEAESREIIDEAARRFEEQWLTTWDAFTSVVKAF